MAENPKLELGQVWREEHHHISNYLQCDWLVVCVDPLSEDLDNPEWILRRLARAKKMCSNCDSVTEFLGEDDPDRRILELFPFRFYCESYENVTLIANSLEEYQEQQAKQQQKES